MPLGLNGPMPLGPNGDSDGPVSVCGVGIGPILGVVGKGVLTVKMVKKEKVPGRVLKAGGTSRNDVVALWK